MRCTHGGPARPIGAFGCILRLIETLLEQFFEIALSVYAPATAFVALGMFIFTIDPVVLAALVIVKPFAFTGVMSHAVILSKPLAGSEYCKEVAVFALGIKQVESPGVG